MDSTKTKPSFKTLIEKLRQCDEKLHLKRRIGMLALSAVAGMLGMTTVGLFDDEI